jgi:hypothetical protein
VAGEMPPATLYTSRKECKYDLTYWAPLEMLLHVSCCWHSFKFSVLLLPLGSLQNMKMKKIQIFLCGRFQKASPPQQATNWWCSITQTPTKISWEIIFHRNQILMLCRRSDQVLFCKELFHNTFSGDPVQSTNLLALPVLI